MEQAKTSEFFDVRADVLWRYSDTVEACVEAARAHDCDGRLRDDRDPQFLPHNTSIADLRTPGLVPAQGIGCLYCRTAFAVRASSSAWVSDQAQIEDAQALSMRRA